MSSINPFLCRLCLMSPGFECLVKVFGNEKDTQSSSTNSSLADKIFSTVGCKVSYYDDLPPYLCKDCVMTVDIIAIYNQWFSNTQAYINHIQTSLEMCKDSGGCKENGQQILLSLSEKRNKKETDSYIMSFIRSLSQMSPCDDSEVSMMIKDVVTKVCTASSTSLKSKDQEDGPEPASLCSILAFKNDCNHTPESKDLTDGRYEDFNDERNLSHPISIMHDTDSDIDEDPTPHQDAADCYEDDQSSESKTGSEAYHKVIEDVSSGPSFMCPECNTSFDKKSILSKHLVSHLGAIEKYQCKMCRKIFISTTELERHTRVHLGLKPYRCNICNKYFSQKNLLQNHMSRHEGRKNYLCELCGQYLSTKSNLSMHMKSLHTLEKKKPFVCEVCGKSFARKHHLENHTTIHASARSHQCAICGMTFKRLSQLQEHEHRHSGEKKYSCKDCNKDFSSKRVLNVHILLHSRVKNYHCTVCTKSFVRRGGLKAHLKTHSK